MNKQTHPASITYGIIGDGRVATNMVRYFSLLGLPFRQWSRAQAHRSSHNPTAHLKQTMDKCSHILLLITDSHVEPFIRAHPFLQAKHLLHCSGNLVSNLAGGYHPLFSFSEDSYALSVYESIPFVCDAGIQGFDQMFPALPNPWTTIERDLKPLYHALCVLSGNLTVLLWKKLFDEFRGSLQIPPEYATAYLQSVVRNLIQNPATALTGPIERRDLATVRENLVALKADPFVRIYRAALDTIDPVFSKEVES